MNNILRFALTVFILFALHGGLKPLLAKINGKQNSNVTTPVNPVNLLPNLSNESDADLPTGGQRRIPLSDLRVGLIGLPNSSNQAIVPQRSIPIPITNGPPDPIPLPNTETLTTRNNYVPLTTTTSSTLGSTSENAVESVQFVLDLWDEKDAVNEAYNDERFQKEQEAKEYYAQQEAERIEQQAYYAQQEAERRAEQAY